MIPRSLYARLRAVTCLAILVLPLLTFADQTPTPVQRPLTHNDYDNWRSVRDQQLSRDGKYLAYDVAQLDGDTELILRELTTGRDQRFTIGAGGGAGGAAPAARGGRGGGGGAAGRIQFTPDNKTLIVPYTPTKAEQAQAKGRGGR